MPQPKLPFMKRYLFALYFTLILNFQFTIFISQFSSVSACTNLIVGKKASVDGSVFCTYNCDGYGFCGNLYSSPHARHGVDERIPIKSWEDGSVRGYVKQVCETYNVIGHINEYQVTITETTFDGRLELENPEGLLDYFTLMRLGLQRSKSAREAIKVMTDLVAEYGYNSTGESLSVCDKNEAWIMEIIGKGPGRKGAVWVAIRIPDDCISAHANLSRIRHFPLKDKANCIYSKDVITFAREMGFFSGKDVDFSFRDAYCPIDFENVRYADARVWSFFRHHYDKEEMDRYLPYINGDFTMFDHLPLYVKPDKPLSLQDVIRDMRDHYEGTPLDMTADMSAGPWGMPIRPMPMTWEKNGERYFTERPIATQKSGTTLVSQMRSWLPDAVGGVCHFNCDDADMVAYIPVYCCVDEVPYAFRPEASSEQEFSEKSAFWMNNFVANMIYPRYSVIIADLREAQQELEIFFAADQPTVEAKVKAMGDDQDVGRYLNAKTAEYTDMMMSRWDKLARLIIVKHNDQVMAPSRDGKVIPGRLSYPGYNHSYYDQIIQSTGSRYKMPQNIERRER